jgi:hypothetical protein
VAAAVPVPLVMPSTGADFVTMVRPRGSIHCQCLRGPTPSTIRN